MDFSATTFKEALQQDLRQSQVQPKVIAEELGKSYSWLMNAGNPDCEEHHLRARDLIRVLRRTGTFHSLDWMEYQLGRVAYKLPKMAGELADLAPSLAKAVSEFGDLLSEMGKALDPEGDGGHKITLDEAKVLEGKIISHTRNIQALLRAVQRECGRE